MIRPIRLISLIIVGCAVLAAAAEPPLTLDQALEQVKSYDYGQPDRALHFLELEIARAATDAAKKAQLAERLGAILADANATQAAKVWCCQQLLLVGTEAQVPILMKLLDDEKLAEMARFTLEGIPGEASLAALRTCLDKFKGMPLVGAINSLGIRRDAKAVPALARLVGGASVPREGTRDRDVPPTVNDLLAAAAVEALGKIGNAEAARALARAELPPKQMGALHDAQLRCAELLAAAGDVGNAEKLYEQVWASKRPVAWRLAGLVGLVKVSKEKATPLVLEALSSGEPLIQASAVRLTKELPGEKVTAALVQIVGEASVPREGTRDGDVPPAVRALLLGVLAERGDRSAAPAVAKLMESKDDAVRAAAVRAMATLGDSALIPRLGALAASERGAVQSAARAALAALAAKDADERLLAAAAEGEAAVRIELLRAIAARRTANATPLLLKAAGDPDEGVRRAAFDALAVVGAPDCYPKLIALLAAATGDTAAIEKAVLAIGARLPSPAERSAPLVAALDAASAQAKPPILRLLGATGGAEALAAVRAHLAQPGAAVPHDAAVRALAAWPDAAAAADLLKLAKDAEIQVHRVIALRGFLRLAGEEKDEAARLKMLDAIRPIATTPDSKKLLLGALSEAPDAGALQVAVSFLDDPEVKGEAAAAALRIGQSLVTSNRQAAIEAAKTLLAKCKDEFVVKQAEALHAEALKPPSGGAGSVPDYDAKRSERMKAEVAKRAPTGYQVVAYLNCGPDASDGSMGKPSLRVVTGQPYRWAGADIRYGTIFFTGDTVAFEASGLNPRKAYQLGFSWWDFDHDTRAQSVWAGSTRLLDKTPLPSGKKGEKPAERVVPIPQALTAKGGARITFRNEAQPNCVVSEVWLLESEADGPQGEAGAQAPVGGASLPREGTKKVLIVTGVDGSHNWKATMRPLADLLEKDPRLACTIVEDPNFLASDELHTYDVVVIHFQNPKALEKGVEGGKNLLKLAESGKGVVIVHFGCGALREWPDFVNVAGRVWDPRLPAHDPRGPFKVNITDVKHPITEGMSDFDTDDELYTCLAGDVPIEVLATAVSKVDKKVYPMAFVATVGKGRVFHCALGHDVRALSFPGVSELYRRGTAWAAGLPPVGK